MTNCCPLSPNRIEGEKIGQGCLTTGDAAAISDKIDAFVDDVWDAVNAMAAGPSRCDAHKIRAAGKKTRAKTACYLLVAPGSEPVLRGADCLTKAEGKFNSAVAKAESGDDCSATGQTDALEDIVDAFLDDLLSELSPSPPTTTTTTSSTTTTAFVPASYGDVSFPGPIPGVPVCTATVTCPDGGDCAPHQGPQGWMCACYPPGKRCEP
jgi:hypothetical protein